MDQIKKRKWWDTLFCGTLTLLVVSALAYGLANEVLEDREESTCKEVSGQWHCSQEGCKCQSENGASIP
jgi:hypothetical protein